MQGLTIAVKLQCNYSVITGNSAAGSYGSVPKLQCNLITRNLNGKLNKNKNLRVCRQPSSLRIPLRCMFPVPRTRVARIQ